MKIRDLRTVFHVDRLLVQQDQNVAILRDWAEQAEVAEFRDAYSRIAAAVEAAALSTEARELAAFAFVGVCSIVSQMAERESLGEELPAVPP